MKNELSTIIETPGDQTRNFLSGVLRETLLSLLEETARGAGHVYAVLYELNDPELKDALKALGKHAHVILANGTHQKRANGETVQADENEAARRELRRVIDLSDRMVIGDHLAHNKFMVICDEHDQPVKAWTGSTNWSMTGLCTQANNGLLIEQPETARLFKEQWERLRAAGDGYPRELCDENSKVKVATVKDKAVSIWFTPVHREEDLEHARRILQNAQQGVLFLMFNPGPKGTLLNTILEMDASKLYIHGVMNQDPGGNANPVLPPVTLFHRGQPEEVSPEVILPAAIDQRFAFWEKELKQYSVAMVHSKTIVVDPFGSYPVVMTGSHNLGGKASRANDDNLVIIENAPDLAAQYAVNIMSIYNQYRWRSMRLKSQNSWDGLSDDDKWQDGYLEGDKKRELDFWFGRATPAAGAVKTAARGRGR